VATLQVYRKPANFRLPHRYTRLTLGGGGQNFSFCRGLNSEIAQVQRYEIGMHWEITETYPYPGENQLTDRSITKFIQNFYSIYVPTNENLFFCVGSNIQGLYPALTNHSGIATLNIEPIDLNALFRAYREGRFEILGQSCITDNNTLKLSQRKKDGQPFAQNDTRVRRGGDVINQNFEFFANVEGRMTPFHVYPDGRITKRGPSPSGTNNFGLLRQVYRDVMRAIR